MTRFNAFKRGDLVAVREQGFRKTSAMYWYKAYTGKHVVFMCDAQGYYVKFCAPGSVELEAISQPGAVMMPEWAA